MSRTRRQPSTSAARSVGIVIGSSSDPALIGQGFLLHVEDRDAVDPGGTDRISYTIVDPSETRRCAVRRPTQLVAAGQIVVEDSTDIDPPEDPIADQ